VKNKEDADTCSNLQSCNGDGQCANRFSEFSVSGANMATLAIASGPMNSLWFTDVANIKIGRMRTDGTFVEFTVPAVPQAISGGPDGNVWFTEAQ
jgi:streptogramin lyase